MTTQTPKRRRIDQLTPGTFVTLGFDRNRGEYEEGAIFLGVSGTGDDRRAHFCSPTSSGTDTYQWEAYRYSGGWAYGSSAQRLSLVGVLA